MTTDTDRLYWRIKTARYLAENRDAVNAKRRERYARNPEARLALQRAARADPIKGAAIRARRRQHYRSQRAA